MKNLFLVVTILISLSVNAQKRKIRANELYIICYTDKKFEHSMAMINHPGDSIIIVKYKGDDILSGDDIWMTVYRGDTVYIHQYDFKEIEEDDIKLERQKEITDSLTSIADSLIKRKFLIKKYGLKMGSFISDGYIKIGMTKEQAKLSWGEPEKIHRTVFATHYHEQWIYSSGKYLYFDNGILIAWQD